MPRHNRFRHQRYDDAPPAAPYRHFVAPPQPAVGSAEFVRGMQSAGQVLRNAGVDHVLLLHGTFVGDDFNDLATRVETWSGVAADRLRGWIKRRVDRLMRDTGNFTAEYAALMSDAINTAAGPAIEVRRFIWGGGNRHLPRAVAAVRLIDEIASLGESNVSRETSARVLCIAHSHAGNALALATNLLAADRSDRRRFLEIVRAAVPRGRRPGLWQRAWQRACDRLDSDQTAGELLGARRLDIVTLGTPIRYGWDTGGYDRLLHFVHQRPVAGLPVWRGKVPWSIEQMLDGRTGDLVHQVGVAGSNFPTLPIYWRQWRGERALKGLISSGVASQKVIKRIRLGLRVADEGTTLLVDYGLPPRRGRLRHFFGHGTQTHAAWMMFHVKHIAREFYELESTSEPAAIECVPAERA